MTGSLEGEKPVVRIYLASSVDGFIAGPGDDLSWLPGGEEAGGLQTGEAIGFEEHLAAMGAILMGRRTWDVVLGPNGLAGPEWPYGDLPVLVATNRELEGGHHEARAVSGPIADLVTEARSVAGGQGVYLDGGDLARQGLRAGLVDEVILTVIPVVLGGGTALFDDTVGRHQLELVGVHAGGGGIAQLHYRMASAR